MISKDVAQSECCVICATIWLFGYLALQSYVSRVYNRGLRTHPWGKPVLRVTEDEMMLRIFKVCGLLVRKSKTQLHRVLDIYLHC